MPLARGSPEHGLSAAVPIFNQLATPVAVVMNCDQNGTVYTFDRISNRFPPGLQIILRFKKATCDSPVDFAL